MISRRGKNEIQLCYDMVPWGSRGPPLIQEVEQLNSAYFAECPTTNQCPRKKSSCPVFNQLKDGVKKAQHNSNRDRKQSHLRV